ncbi:MAG: Panacea domain-containing protein [Flavobacteriales bacterium]
MKNINASTVAKELINISYREEGTDITNLKLQKLLYYVQGTSISMLGEKMFPEKIIKWQYGPVVKNIYHEYKEYSNQIIPIQDQKINIPKKYLDVINMVYDFFGQYSAVKLMHMTHSEPPWNTVEIGEEITGEIMKPFFDSIITED